MKKIFFFLPVLVLIIATTITKNSTKKMDRAIFEIQENMRVLENKLELLLLDYNYLTSPKKLSVYQKQYFENDLVQIEISDFKWMNVLDDQIKIETISKKNE